MKILIVVDMQNDFIDGSLGTKEAQAIVPNVINKIESADTDTLILFTQDTHSNDYLNTQEGKNLPVPHCIVDTNGWEINQKIIKAYKKGYHDKKYHVNYLNRYIYTKASFGSVSLMNHLLQFGSSIKSIELIGLCTDICVISNATLAKSFLNEIPIIVDASCCAGTTPESHKNAIEVMKKCQIKIINEEV